VSFSSLFRFEESDETEVKSLSEDDENWDDEDAGEDEEV
jgi:hypothetical protein